MAKEVILQTLVGRTSTDPGTWVTWTRYDDRANAIARGHLLQKDGLVHFRVKPLLDEEPMSPGAIPGCYCPECWPMSDDPVVPPRAMSTRPKRRDVMDIARENTERKKQECSVCAGTICEPGGTEGACLL